MYGQPPGYGAPGYGAPGYGAPGYGAPGYGAPQGGPTVIQINNDDNDGTPCQYCGTNTNHTTRRKVGCVTIAWSLCLLGTGVLWCIPCFVDGCKDVELICIKCQNVKGTI